MCILFLHGSLSSFLPILITPCVFTRNENSCARCGHTRRLPSDPSNNGNGNGGLNQQGRKKRPLSPSSLAGMVMEDGGDGDVEAAMLAAVLAASAAEQEQVCTIALEEDARGVEWTWPAFHMAHGTQGPSSGGGNGGGEEATMARALAASTLTWQCGACTLENVGDGVKVGVRGMYGVGVL